MHNCEEFRERITEFIMDREEISELPEFKRDLLMCSGCAEFYGQSREMIEALDGIDLQVTETQWWGIERRLQAAIIHSQPRGRGYSPPFPKVPKAAAAVFASAAALALITITLSRLAIPVGNQPTPVVPETAVYVDHSVPLDPVTVDFLEESELLLRNVMKIEAADVEDLADARKAAGAQLAELEQRKEAAAEALPVVSMMETYETILRDLRNVDEQSVDEDISDIQRRIQKNGLIANMKAFQPRVTEVSFGGR